MHKETGEVWFEAAERTSREQLQGPLYKIGNQINKLFTGVGLDDWRSAAGEQIMSHGYGNFLKVYEGLNAESSSGWSIAQLVSEQRDPGLQAIHEDYIQNWMWGLKGVTEAVGGTEDILDPAERISTGCRAMGMEKGCGE